MVWKTPLSTVGRQKNEELLVAKLGQRYLTWTNIHDLMVCHFYPQVYCSTFEYRLTVFTITAFLLLLECSCDFTFLSFSATWSSNAVKTIQDHTFSKLLSLLEFGLAFIIISVIIDWLHWINWYYIFLHHVSLDNKNNFIIVCFLFSCRMTVFSPNP